VGLDEGILEAALRESGYGGPVRVLETTSSTNLDALRWAEGGAPEGAVVVADHQTGGRGRKGRSWLSEPGRALLFSVILRPAGGNVALLSTAVGVGACEGVRSLTRLSTLLKWPNDLVIDDRKLAGILVESRFSASSSPLVIVGLGLNVSWGPAELPVEIAAGATSVATEMERSRLGDPPAREELLVHLLMNIERRYRHLMSGEAGDLVTTAESLSALVGREVVVRLPAEEVLTGTVTGLDDDGRLELETDAGYRALSAGEVETVRRT
jgi:BirA family transcriptional regulator, biotin operon repressor / biotin---[acetyl-CoA-carboxylase] ligase